MVAGRSGADVRVTLALLLPEQAFLLAAAQAAASDARLDDLIAVSGVLDQNSVALAQFVGAVKGPAAAQDFAAAWRAVIADQLRAGAAARPDLASQRGRVIDGLSLVGFPAAAPNQARLDAQQQIGEALAHHDAATAAAGVRALGRASDEVAAPFAAAAASQLPVLAGTATTGADVDLRLALAHGWQAHVYLTGLAAAAAAGGRPGEAEAYRAAMEANAIDLGALVAGAWGADVGGGVRDRLAGAAAELIDTAAGAIARRHRLTSSGCERSSMPTSPLSIRCCRRGCSDSRCGRATRRC